MSKRAAIFAAGLAVYVTAAQAEDHSVSAKAEFMFDGAKVAIAPMALEASRHAALFAALDPSCDPYCIAPEVAAPGVDTLIEPDVLAFLENGVGTNAGLLVDARMPHDRDLGFIPGSVSLPVDTVSSQSEFRNDILKALGARAFEDVFNFADAQSLVVYDNGPTQNDAGRLIGYLLDAGYPSEKIRYYRGGMQVWSVLGLTVQE
ncbi:rhodanese-like domain-containing protein [Sulfitobacter sp.]|uniref:rhodanese-like domain-containing protein n=1 Tax=Sulfitobacter sp. TaxID=1903071 RepID=UPI0030034D4C